MEDKDKIILVELLNKHMDENNMPRADEYVVGYYQVKDDKLIGYHLSTSCQITDDILDAKRYSGDNPYAQLEIISKSLKYVLDSTEEEPGFFGMGNAIREEHFEGYHHSEIYLQAVYLAEDTPNRPVIYTYK